MGWQPLFLYAFCKKFMFMLSPLQHFFFFLPTVRVVSVMAVFNQPQGEEGQEMRTEALSQVLPFTSCNNNNINTSNPRVQHAALRSLERMAEDQNPGDEGITQPNNT